MRLYYFITTPKEYIPLKSGYWNGFNDHTFITSIIEIGNKMYQIKKDNEMINEDFPLIKLISKLKKV